MNFSELIQLLNDIAAKLESLLETLGSTGGSEINYK